MVAALVMLIAMGSGFTFSFAQPTLMQTQPPCPTYQTNLSIDVVDATPANAAVGGTVVLKFHVIYNDGTPVTLQPEIASFLWTGSQGHVQFDNVAVTSTGEPGFYTYSQQVTQALLDATGGGAVTVSVVVCSCSDGRGNRGPTGNTDSDGTLTPSDNSKVSIGPGGGPQPPSFLSYLVPLIIAALLIIALLLFLLRSRKKKKS